MDKATTSRIRRYVTSAGCALFIAAVVVGCASPASDKTEAEVSPAPAAVSTAPASAAAGQNVTDAESCEAFGDVSTILVNASTGLREGRMMQQEYDGWMRLATRVLDRVPVRGEGDVSEAIKAFKAASPPISPGATAPTPINTPEWNNTAPLYEACSGAGASLSAEGFTGG